MAADKSLQEREREPEPTQPHAWDDNQMDERKEEEVTQKKMWRFRLSEARNTMLSPRVLSPAAAVDR